MERARAAKGKDPIRLIELDRLLIRLNRAHNAARKAYEDAVKRNNQRHQEAAE